MNPECKSLPNAVIHSECPSPVFTVQQFASRSAPFTQDALRNPIASAVTATLPDLPTRPSYLTVAQFSIRNPAFTEPSIRNLVFKADPRESTRGRIPGNGLIEAGAIVRLGTKVLIHEGRFFAWVDAHGAGK